MTSIGEDHLNRLLFLAQRLFPQAAIVLYLTERDAVRPIATRGIDADRALPIVEALDHLPDSTFVTLPRRLDPEGEYGVGCYVPLPAVTRYRGGLCVLESVSREHDRDDVEALTELARLAVEEIDHRGERGYSEVIFMSDPHPRWIYNVDTFRILDANEAAQRKFGYTREEFRELTILDLCPEDDHPALRRYLNESSVGSRTSGPWRHLTRDGDLVYIEVTSYPVQVDGARCRMVSVRDVTEYVHTLLKLDQSEFKYRRFFLQSSESVVLNENGQIVDVNEASARLLDLPRKAIIGRNLVEFVHPDDRPRLTDLKNQNQKAGELRLLSPSGKLTICEYTLANVRVEDRRNVIMALRNVTSLRGIDLAYKESEERFRSLINSLNDTVWTVGRDHRFTGIFGQWWSTFGLNESDVLGRTATDVFGPEVGRAFEIAIECTLQGENIQYLTEIRRSERTYAMHLSLSPLRNPSGQIVGVVGVARDHTEIRDAQRALLESEAKFRNLVEGSPAGIYIIQDGRFVYVNEAHANILGRTPEDMLALDSVLDVIYEPDRIKFKENVRRRLERETKSLRYDLRCMRADGSIAECEVIGTVTEFRGRPAIIGTILDVTELRSMVRALRESEARQSALLDALPDIMIRLDRNGTLLDFRAPNSDLFYRPTAEIIGHTFTEFVPRSVSDAWLSGIRIAIDSRKLYTFEFRLPMQDGVERDFEARLAPSGTEEVVAVVRDVTDQKNFERELIEAKEKAEEMNHLKSSFLANMSHEIRTPLTSVIGFADILAEEVSGDSREFAHLIHKSGKRLLDTLNSVLDLAQLESHSIELKNESVDLAELTIETASLFQIQANEKGLYLSLEIPPGGDPVAVLDRGAATRILQNLLSNAVKFTRRGGITVRVRPTDDHVQIDVEDTGIGIDPEFLPFIFDEFKQASSGLSRTFEGNGLGLAIARRLAELMGVTIQVKSRKNEGSLFTVSFPREPLDYRRVFSTQ